VGKIGRVANSYWFWVRILNLTTYQKFSIREHYQKEGWGEKMGDHIQEGKLETIVSTFSKIIVLSKL